MNAKVEEVDTILDPEELADIEAEQIEMAEEHFRAERWPAYVTYVDSLVWFLIIYTITLIIVIMMRLNINVKCIFHRYLSKLWKQSKQV